MKRYLTAAALALGIGCGSNECKIEYSVMELCMEFGQKRGMDTSNSFGYCQKKLEQSGDFDVGYDYYYYVSRCISNYTDENKDRVNDNYPEDSEFPFLMDCFGMDYPWDHPEDFEKC